MTDAYQVTISARALRDLTRILDYVSLDSPGNADDLVKQIVRKTDTLDVLPARFRQVGRSRATRRPVHMMIVDPYLVYYRIDEAKKSVLVMTIWHGKRQQPRSFP
jgi:plasmid stabilization system protein ParE